MILDELQKKYFSTPEEYENEMKLLHVYTEATFKYPSFDEFQEKYLDYFEDDADSKTVLVSKVEAYYEERNTISAGGVATKADLETLIRDALLEQPTMGLNSMPLEEAFNKFIAAKQ